MAISAAHFFRQLGQLFPSGPLWESMGATYQAVRQVFANELSRVETQYDAWQREIDPRTAIDTLTQWEDTLGLPHDGSTAERQARVAAREVAVAGTRPQDYQTQLAPLLGPFTVRENKVTSPAVVADERDIYRFFLYRDPGAGGTYYVEAAQAEADAMSRAATSPHVIESVNFLCFDPYSLCDRDLLGI